MKIFSDRASKELCKRASRCTCADLVTDVVDHRLRQLGVQSVQDLGGRESHFLYLGVGFAGAAFHDVARQRERGANKAKHS
jgi:hypothetical protein